MRRRLLPLCAFAIVIGLVMPLAAQDTESEYYPLKVGNTWEYLVNGKKVSMRVAKFEKYNGVMCALVETADPNGTVVASEHISVNKDGIYRHSMAGQKAEPAVLFFRLPVKSGDTWKVDAKIGAEALKVEYTFGEEEITVPAGKYKSVSTKTSKFKSGGQDVEATVYYAKGVGMVKTVVNLGGQAITLELNKFTPGTDK